MAETPQQLQITLSGLNGLAPLYYGDKPFSGSNPNYRYLGSGDQMAEGIYNPLMRFGYMSPANDTPVTVTGGTTAILSSGLVVPYNLGVGTTDAIWFADEQVPNTAGSLLTLDSASDLSLSSAHTLSTFTGLSFTVSANSSTDVLTMTAPDTVEEFGFANNTTILYTGTTIGGFVNGTTYFIINLSGETFQISTSMGGSALNITASGTFSFQTIIGATQYTRSEDLILYEINGVPKIFYTRMNTTGGQSQSGHTIGRINVSGSGSADTWSSTIATNGTWALLKGEGRIVFVLADNGFLYVLNGNVVHKIDGTESGGTNGTITADILTFMGSEDVGGPDTITRLIDGMDLNGFMYMGLHVQPSYDTIYPSTYNTSNLTIPLYVGVYRWDRSETTVGTQNFIPIKGVREIKSMCTFQGQPACFTVSVDGYTELRVFNGTSFKIVQKLGKNAWPPYRRHSIHEMDDYIMWIGNDGKIYAYGILEPGLNNSVYILGDMSTHITNSSTFVQGGVLIAANDVETVTTGNNTQTMAFYLSWSDSLNANQAKWYPFGLNTVASTAMQSHAGNVYSLVQAFPKLATVQNVTFNCLPLGASGDNTTVATVSYYFNQSATPFATKTITRNDISKGYISHELNKPYVNAIQIKIAWATGVTAGPNDFCPSNAIVTYEPIGFTPR